VPQDLYWKTTYYAVQAEKKGFKNIWITDHFNNRNVYVSLTIIATYTNRIKLGPGVTNPYLNHPVTTAQAVASLNEIAPGRVTCGMGVGDRTTLQMLGADIETPLTAIKESMESIKQMLSGDSVKYEGKKFNMKGGKFNFKVTGKIPIFIGAQGPKMLELASRIGDGVLINASHKLDIERAMKYIQSGLEKSGKESGGLDVAAYTSFSIDNDVKKAEQAVKPVVAYIVAGSPQTILDRHKISADSAKQIGNYIMQAKWGEAFSKVTPEMIEAFSICGNPDECIEKVSKLIKLGVTQVVSGSPLGLNVREAINLLGSDVLPAFMSS
jgi:5,10-methylenetetrahydromethanopterin reductase